MADKKKREIQIAGNNSTQVNAEVINVEYKVKQPGIALRGELINAQDSCLFLGDKLLTCRCCNNNFYISRHIIMTPSLKNNYLIRCPHCGFTDSLTSYNYYW